MGRNQNQAEASWRSRMTKFRGSNLTVVEFCRRESVSVPSFYHWRKRLEQGRPESKRRRRSGNGSQATAESNPFVPVKVSSSPMAEIEFPNGVQIRVPATNIEALRAAVLAGNEACRKVSSC